MVDLANVVWDDFNTAGIPASGKKKPEKSKIREWGTYIESLTMAAQYGNTVWFATKALLTADLAHAAGVPAIVYADTTAANNGIYIKAGASGAGSWGQIITYLPGYQFVTATDAGAGTANAIVATSSPRVAYTDGVQLIRLNIYETNTSGTVTVAFDGGAALTIKTASNNSPAVGGLVAGMTILGVVDQSASVFRMLSDQSGSAIQAAAEAALASFRGVYLGAQASDPTLDLNGDPVNAGDFYFSTSLNVTRFYDGATWVNAPAGVDGAGSAALFGTVALMVADTTMDYTGGTIDVSAGDIVQAGVHFYTVATSAASDHHLTTAGGVKLYALPGDSGYNAKAFGAVGDGTTDDTTALAAWATVGGEGIWPEGSYRITSGLDLSAFDSLNPRNVIVIPDMTSGTAITFQAASGAQLERKTFGGADGVIRVHWAARDWTVLRRAFYVRNAYNCTFGMSWLNATVGAEFHGDETGCVHNDVYLKECWNHMLGIRCSSASATGWSNSNRFHGGFFYGTSTAGMVTAGLYSIATHILVDSSPYLCNGNKFLDQSLEWVGPDFQLYQIGGLKNYIRPMYAEFDSPTAGTTKTGAWATDFGTENEHDIMASPYLSGYDALDVSNSRIDASGATRPIIRGRVAHYNLGTTGYQYWYSVRANRPTMHFQNGDAGAALWLERAADGVFQVMRLAGTTIGSITNTGSTTYYNTTSDETYKDFGEPSLDEGEVIKSIAGLLAPFIWKATGRLDYGLSAQEAFKVLPDMVTPGKGEEGDEDFMPWSVDWSKAVPRLIAYVATLERRLAKLEAV